jgi:colicin import membrane protein
MASAHEPEDFQAVDREVDLEPSRFLPDDSKPAGFLIRLKENRFFVIFITCSVIFHAGLIWLAQSFDLPSFGGQLKVLEIPVDLLSEEQARKAGGQQQNGGGGPSSKGGNADAAKQKQLPGDNGSKDEPRQQDSARDRAPEKSSQDETQKLSGSQDKPVAEDKAETKSQENRKLDNKPQQSKPSVQPETKSQAQDQKPALQKEQTAAQNPQAPTEQNPLAQQQPALVAQSQASQSQLLKNEQSEPVASPQFRLPTFLQQSNDFHINAIPVPMPTEDSDGESVSYKVIVFGQLERAKRDLQSTGKRHAIGYAVVAFSIDNTGQPQNVELLRPSGEADIDRDSLSVISRAAPFPVPPAGARRNFGVIIDFGDK